MAAAGCGEAGPREGPLGNGGRLISTQTTGTEVGATFTFGGPLLVNRTSEPLTLTEVEVVGVTDGLRLLDVRIAGADRPYLIGDDQGWPPEEYPPGKLHRAEGYTIAPGTDAQLVAGLDPRRPGDYLVRGFRVRYRSGRSAHQDVLRMRLRLCTGRNAGRCGRVYDTRGNRRRSSSW